MRILFLSAEVKPFSNVGGLGDVSGSLPVALRESGHDVRVVTPAYRATEDELRRGSGPRALEPILVSLGGPGGEERLEAGVLVGRLPGSEVPVYFLARRELYDRERTYGYVDDPRRFVFLCRGAFEILNRIDWAPELVHANDWHTAPAVSWIARGGDARFGGIPTLLTIHNLAHQGWAPREILASLGVPAHPAPGEPSDRANLLARGIADATSVSTVSPTYAREILEPELGAGLHGLLRLRREELSGIVNGLDYAEWDPARDRFLLKPFDAAHLGGRRECRRELQRRLGLPVRDGVPIVGMVSRLDRQKGLDIAPAVFELLLRDSRESQLVVLGSGAAGYAATLRTLAGRYPGKMAAALDAFDAELAHQIYAGSDIFLMPSLFEPCGLSQLIAMRYGSVPVVRGTGGLVDTVTDGVTGFCFSEFSAGAFWGALERALLMLRDSPGKWKRIQAAGMAADTSWGRSAESYGELYRRTVERGAARAARFGRPGAP